MTELNSKVFDFASQKKAVKKAENIGSFVIGEDTFEIRPIKDAQVAYLVHRMSGNKSDKVISAVLDFTHKALTPESAERFEEVALDPENGLELEEIVEIFEYILEVLGDGTPPTSATASSAPSRTTGTKSRATRS